MIVLTSYFNPSRSLRRLQNYRLFRSRLGCRLLTIELSFDGQFDLSAGDADQLIQLSGGDVLWQKERLLNIGLRAVPAGIDDIAWIDGDVLFERSDWPDAARAALRQYRMVQLFSQVSYLEREDDPDDPAILDRHPSTPGSVHLISEHGPDILAHPNTRPDGRFQHCPGMAFAIKREIADAVEFYDVSVVGGGDWLGVCACFGRKDVPVDRINMNARWKPHYLAWAERARRAVDGRIGHVEGRIGHLWHGELKNRKYYDRYRIVAGFDPARDLMRLPNGVWAWTDPGSQLARDVRDYFAGRREDG